MAETPLTDSIEALTTYANQVTGASDTNLSDAVYTLAQGYGESDILWSTTLTENSYRITYNIPDNVLTEYDTIAMFVYIASASTIEWFYGYYNNLNDSTPYILLGAKPLSMAATLVKDGNGRRIRLVSQQGSIKEPLVTGNYMGVRCFAVDKYFAAGTKAYVIGFKE